MAASATIPGYAVAHADGVPAVADQNVALTLPRPVAPSAPPNASSVQPGTPFNWSTLGQTAQVFVWHLESEGYYEGIYFKEATARVEASAGAGYVITARSAIEYPTVPGYGMVLPTPDDDFGFYWSVETHGDYPSVDAAAGPEGLYDAFALELNIPTGPSRGNRGYYSNSEIRTVDVVAQ